MVPPPKQVGPAVATIAILAVLSLAFGGMSLASSGAPSRSYASPAPSGAAHASKGLAQLASAQASLAKGHAPLSGRSGGETSEISPGGYLWSNLTGIVGGTPSARYGEAMTWDASDGYVLLFGGENTNMIPVADTWSYLNGTWTNLTGLITGAPPAVVLPGLAYDPSTHSVILFGGVNLASVATGWTWSYHNRTWTNLSATVGTVPGPRLASAMSTDSTDGQILLFGGTNESSWLGDTWTFKNGHWTNITAVAGGGFGPLQLPLGSDDPAEHGVLVRANYPSGVTYATATLVYSGGSWRNVTSSLAAQPPTTELGADAYLAPIQAVVSVSGIGYNQSGSTVLEGLTAEYTPGAWNNVTSVTAGPPALYVLSAGAVAGSDESFLSFGVWLSGSSFVPSTWILSAPPKVTASANHDVVDQGGSVSFTGSVSEGAAPYTYHWSFGDGSTGATTLSGAHAYAHSGTYAANLTVTDLVGHSVTASVIITVSAPLAFTASATPSPAAANSTVALTSSASGGTAPYSYHWNLGDGSTSTSAGLGHVYARAGNYTVTANVTDALGTTSTSSFTLAVGAAAHSASGGSSGSSSVSLTSGTGLYLLLGIVLLAIVVVALAVMLARRPKSPPGPPAQYYSGPGAPPPGAGPTGAPPAAWSETPPQPPR